MNEVPFEAETWGMPIEHEPEHIPEISPDLDEGSGRRAQPGLFGGIQKAAIISPDGRYRYSLERWWDTGEGTVLFARSWGYEGLIVWNLYAYRATDPDELDRTDDPIGHDNALHLWRMLPDVDLIVAAWGAKPNRGHYALREAMMLVGPFYDRDLHCLGLTKEGHPRHPLRLRADLRPMLWQPAGTDSAVAA